MSEKAIFAKFFGIIALAVIGIVGLMFFLHTAEEDNLKEREFRGTVIGTRSETVNRSRRSDEVIYLQIQIENGPAIEYRIDGMSAEYYQPGDFMIKLKGDPVPAVYRSGKQLKNSPAYLRRDVPISTNAP